jgi:hypothetical protein
MATIIKGKFPLDRKKTPAAAYQLKIILLHTKPPVWRRVQVPSIMKLSRFHDVIQHAMGWTDSHLHQFMIGGSIYGPADLDGGWSETRTLNEKKFRLRDLEADMRQEFTYEYDFGDGWQHRIKLEKVSAPDEETPGHPLLLGGKRACPPEDVGGPFGYEDFLAAVRDPKNPEHENMLEWYGSDFDPEYFAMDGINRLLKKIK